MKSIAHNQFPRIIWKEEKKLLWNPIHKKTLKNRPEERVRLRILEYLLQAGWSKHRITTEEAIRDYAAEQLRTDIICYNQGFEPQLLVECKAENVTLTTETAQQIGRYNRNVEAPFLLISNGQSDFWYHLPPAESSIKKLDTIPEPFAKPENRATNYEYWKERGFAGSKAVPALRSWLTPLLDAFAEIKDTDIRYLQFNKTPTDLELNHYYWISKAGHSRMALSFLNTAFGGTRLIAILNRDGVNRAVAEINLDLVFGDEHPNASIYSAQGITNFDILKKHQELFSNGDKPAGMDEVSEALTAVFKQYLDPDL